MGKKKPATTEEQQPQQTPAATGEIKKVPGRTLGNWRTEFQKANPTATTQEIADAVNARATKEGFSSPEWTADKVAAAQLRDTDGQSEGGGEPRTTRTRAAAPAAPSGPTLADLMTVKECADQEGGAKALLAQVVVVDDLAQRTGGLPQLRKCLEALVQLTGGK